MAELIVIEGEEVGKSYPLSNEVCTLGADSSNTIPLSDRRIAPTQAKIEAQNSNFVLTNLCPQKNIYVNGTPLQQPYTLQHGDTFQIGKTLFLFSHDPSLEMEVETTLVSDHSESSLEVSQVAPLKDEHVDSFLNELAHLDQQRRLSTLYNVSHTINSTSDMTQLLRKLLEIIFQEFPNVDRGVILLFDEERARFLPVASKAREGVQNKAVRVSKTILKACYKNKEAVLSNDTMFDERFMEGLSITEENIHSAMCVPLMSKGEVLGFVFVDTISSGQHFQKDQLNFLTAISMQAAVAIANARNYQKYKNYIQKLIDLGKATQDFSTYLQRDLIIKSLGRHLFKIHDCRHCMLALLNEQNKINFYPYVLRSRKGKWDETQLDVIRDLCKKVVLDNKPILISDLTFDPDLYFEEREEKVDSFLIVPIPSKSEDIEIENQAIGAICVSEKNSGGAFLREDQELLTILANQVGVALANAILYEKATVDSLTKVFVRRYFFQHLEKHVKKSKRQTQPLVLLMMDLDKFKQKNDTYGHQAGDYILQETGKILKKNVRSDGIVARYGGEEFAIILPNTSADIGRKIAERVRTAVEEHPYIFEGTHIPCTLSIGMALCQPQDSVDSLIKRADEALYQAKEGGRNQVVYLG